MTDQVLDFEKAYRRAVEYVEAAYDEPGEVPINAHRLAEQADLQAQAVALRDQAVKEERALADLKAVAAFDAGRQEVEAKYAPLLAAWKEWKTAREAFKDHEFDHAYYLGVGDPVGEALVAASNRAAEVLASVEDV